MQKEIRPWEPDLFLCVKCTLQRAACGLFPALPVEKEEPEGAEKEADRRSNLPLFIRYCSTPPAALTEPTLLECVVWSVQCACRSAVCFMWSL